NALRREYKFDDFSGAVDFVNRLTPIANEMNHHPDLFISWGLARVSLISHSEHGITEKDFELAKKLDELAQRRSLPGTLRNAGWGCAEDDTRLRRPTKARPGVDGLTPALPRQV